MASVLHMNSRHFSTIYYLFLGHSVSTEAKLLLVNLIPPCSHFLPTPMTHFSRLLFYSSSLLRRWFPPLGVSFRVASQGLSQHSTWGLAEFQILQVRDRLWTRRCDNETLQALRCHGFHLRSTLPSTGLASSTFYWGTSHKQGCELPGIFCNE